jgi:hypothetical protein
VTGINWGRVVVGSLVAGLIAFISDGFLHEKLLAADWKAVYDALAARPPQHGSGGLAYFAVFELGRGVLTMLLYVLLRTPFGPGPRTAALAGVASWIAFSLTGPAQFIPLGFFSHALWFKAGAFQLVTSILAALGGAALYKPATVS